MKIKDLFKDVPNCRFNGDGKTEVQGLAYSSKEVRPGDLFAAMPGMKKDGFEFIEEAQRNGAAGILPIGILASCWKIGFLTTTTAP